MSLLSADFLFLENLEKDYTRQLENVDAKFSDEYRAKLRVLLYAIQTELDKRVTK